MNEDSEFLLVQYKDSDKIQFPKTLLPSESVSGWEAMEHALSDLLKSQVGVAVADGQIPFTDQIIMDKEQYDTLVQFFICRFESGEASVQQPELLNAVRWVHLNDIDRNEVDEKDYLMLYKAHEFISALRTN